MPRHRTRTPRTARLLALALVAALAASLVACGADGEVGTGDGPSTTGGGTTDPGPLDLPADQVVWEDTSGGGMVPPSPLAPNISILTIYADGRAFQAAAPSDRDHLDPIPITVGTVSPEDLAALVDAAEASGLFASGDTDFGDPQVTDLGSQAVRFHGRGTEVEVSAYAFDEQFDDDLTEAQRDRRRALRDLLDQAEAAVTDVEPYAPERIAVAELDGSEYRSDSDDPQPWPGPAVESILEPTDVYGASGCGELAGPEAAAVWEAALAEPGTSWVDGDDRHELVVAALLPGQDPCADR